MDLPDVISEDVIAVHRVTNAEKMMELFLATDIIRSKMTHNAKLKVYLPYMPYGRQDRRTSPNQPDSLAVFAKMLNCMQYNSVYTLDPHSKVQNDKINNLFRVTHEHYIKRAIEDFKPEVLVCPDEGAIKRVCTISELYDIPVSFAEKVREPTTGRITHYEMVPSIINGKDTIFSAPVQGLRALVIDDICDGGATFILLGKALKKAKCEFFGLYVTHGIFSKGFDSLVYPNGDYDKIYTTTSFRTLDKSKLGDLGQRIKQFPI